MKKSFRFILGFQRWMIFLIIALASGAEQIHFENKPVRIMNYVTNNGVGEFVINQKVIDDIFLNEHVRDRKVVVMSIIGEFRKGKSFFLDYCLRFLYANYASTSNLRKPPSESATNWLGDGNESLKGFSWRHGYEADTKGILFWPDVFLYDAPDGEKIAIILMDTQGLFEIGSTQDENARIFGISILTSSIQIVNLKDVIQENQIEYLDMATSFTKYINQKLSKGKKHDWKAFQSLLFLIRDWQHEEIEGGLGYGGGEIYLNKFLNSEKALKSESIRKNIRESFDSIKCFFLNHPGSAVSKKNFNGEWSRLNKDFVSKLKILVESLLKPEKFIKKSIFGKEVTGGEFRDFLSTYLQAFRDAKLPDIGNIFQLTIDIQMKALVAEILQEYENAMNEKLDYSQEDFERNINNKHKDTKALAVRKFLDSDKMEDPQIVSKFQNILEMKIEKSFTAFMRTQVLQLVKTLNEEELKNLKEKNAKDIERIKIERAKDKEEFGRMKIEIEEKMKSANEKQSRQSQEKLDKLEKEFSEREEKRKKEEFWCNFLSSAAGSVVGGAIGGAFTKIGSSVGGFIGNYIGKNFNTISEFVLKQISRLDISIKLPQYV